MRAIAVIFQFACAVLLHASERPGFPHTTTIALAQQFVERGGFDKLFDNLHRRSGILDHPLSPGVRRPADVDATTLGKPGHLSHSTMSSRTSMRALSSPFHSQHTRSEPGWPVFRHPVRHQPTRMLLRSPLLSRIKAPPSRVPIARATVDKRSAPDLVSRFLQDSGIFLCADITPDTAELIIAQLLYLQAEKPMDVVNLYINSGGGDYYGLALYNNALAIYDTMNYISPEVSTFCFGEAKSVAALILAAGVKGKRACLPNARINTKMPAGQTRGQASDIVMFTSEMVKAREQVNEILAVICGKSIREILEITERPTWFDGEEAVKFGLIDSIEKKQVRLKRNVVH